jgi:spore coat protein U-like protein
MPTAGTSRVSTAVTGTTTISATCTNGSPYSIGFDNGANYLTTRRMATGGVYLGYGLYIDSGFTRPWTTALTNSTCTVLNGCFLGTGTGVAQTISVYGQVPTVATAPASGTYSDTVNMTITY